MSLALGWLIANTVPSTSKISICIVVVILLAGVYLIWRTHNEDKKRYSLEKPWNMATIKQHPIAPETLSAVRNVWRLRNEKGDNLTIREAIWVSTLSGQLTDIDKLSYKAWQYARTELMFELLGRPFDSSVLDKLLMGLPAGIGNLFDFLALLAEQKEDKEKGIKDGVEQIRDLIHEKQSKRKIERLRYYLMAKREIIKRKISKDQFLTILKRVVKKQSGSASTESSESHPSGDYSGKHTHQDKTGDT